LNYIEHNSLTLQYSMSPSPRGIGGKQKTIHLKMGTAEDIRNRGRLYEQLADVGETMANFRLGELRWGREGCCVW
jgi:hypothetical protein